MSDTTSELTNLRLFKGAVKVAFPQAPKLHQVDTFNSMSALWQELPGLLGLPIQTVTQQLAEQCELQPVHRVMIPGELMNEFPEQFVEKHAIAPFEHDQNTIKVAISDPFDEDLIKQIRFITNQKAQFYLCPPTVIEEALHVYYSSTDSMRSFDNGLLVIQEGHPAASNLHAVVVLARKLLHDAVEAKASDVHFQPFLGGGEVRQRVDGVLHRVALIPNAVYAQLCRYFKAQSGMDPSNDRITQDGRLSLDIGKNEFELRMSILPARGGERLVIRILNQQRSFNLSDSGMAIAEMQKMRELLGYPSGIVLMTGPTGSGKTTTLYSLLGELNNPEKNILTIENPVEYVLPGISQVEINTKAGLTFASALRSALRQDPDIIMLGEIRDSETAKVATQAALTGHMVLSTVHTNDAVSAITRLQDLGIKDSVIVDSVIGIVSQRLCRKLCEHCKVVSDGQLSASEQAFKTITKIAPGFKKAGCAHCSNTGYLGRFPVTEILHIETQYQRDLIMAGRAQELADNKNKLNTLSAISSSLVGHIVSGETTVDEAVAVVGNKFWRMLADEYGTAVPEINAISSLNKNTNTSAVLWLASDPIDETMLRELQAGWFTYYHATDSAQAKELLKEKSEIVFLVGDTPDDMSDEEAVEFVHQARVDMAWCRLPAMLLIPEGRESLESKLLEQGATFPLYRKPLSPEQIVQHIKTGLSSG